MRFPLIKRLQDLDIASIAVAIGPVLIACSILAIAFEMKRASDELHVHVVRVLNRDVRLIPAIDEIQDHVKNHENHMRTQENQNAEILRNQKEILVALSKVKLGDFMSDWKKSYPYAGASISEDHTLP